MLKVFWNIKYGLLSINLSHVIYIYTSSPWEFFHIMISANLSISEAVYKQGFT